MNVNKIKIHAFSVIVNKKPYDAYDNQTIRYSCIIMPCLNPYKNVPNKS